MRGRRDGLVRFSGTCGGSLSLDVELQSRPGAVLSAADLRFDAGYAAAASTGDLAAVTSAAVTSADRYADGSSGRYALMRPAISMRHPRTMRLAHNLSLIFGSIARHARKTVAAITMLLPRARDREGRPAKPLRSVTVSEPLGSSPRASSWRRPHRLCSPCLWPDRRLPARVRRRARSAGNSSCVYGLSRGTWPLAMMMSEDRVPRHDAR